MSAALVAGRAGVQSPQSAARCFTRVVNLTGVPLAIEMSPGNLARVPVDPASPALPTPAGNYDSVMQLRLAVGGREETTMQYTYRPDVTLDPETFLDAAFIERARNALVVVRPEHWPTLSYHLEPLGVTHIVCVRGGELYIPLDGVRHTIVDRGFYSRVA